MIPRRIVTLLALVLCFLAPLSAVTRVSFIHPGFMMKIPTTFIERSPYLFSSGFTTEIHNFSPYNQVTGVFFSMDVSDRFTLGFSSGTGANPWKHGLLLLSLVSTHSIKFLFAKTCQSQSVCMTSFLKMMQVKV